MKQALKRWVQRQAHSRGFEFRRVNDVLRPEIDLLGALAEWTFGEVPPTSFIQVGGNDGRTHDPLQALIDRTRMRGVIVEPLPAACAALTKLYAGRGEVRVIQAAVAPRGGLVPLYRIECDDPTATERMSVFTSLDRANLQRYVRVWRPHGGRIVSSTVRAVTPAELLAGFAPASPEVVCVDIEGLDDMCVGGLLDAGAGPRLICYEHIHLSPSRDMRLVDRLHEYGYRLVRAGWDTYAIKELAAAAVRGETGDSTPIPSPEGRGPEVRAVVSE